MTACRLPVLLPGVAVAGQEELTSPAGVLAEFIKAWLRGKGPCGFPTEQA